MTLWIRRLDRREPGSAISVKKTLDEKARRREAVCLANGMKTGWDNKPKQEGTHGEDHKGTHGKIVGELLVQDMEAERM